MIRLASEKDVKSILEIIKDAKAFLKENNVNQWQDNYPNEDTIINDINKKQLYVYEEKEVLAFIAIIEGIEETYNIIYDGKWLNDDSYLTIHRIAVKKEARHCNIASKLFMYAIEYANKRNIKSIRVDTHKDNIVMQKLILKHDFKKCGYIYLKDHSPRLAYERLV